MSKLTIPIRINEEEELYSPFDPSGLTLSNDLEDYLEKQLENRKPGEDVSIEIVAHVRIDSRRFREAYTQLFQKLQTRNKREMAESHIRAARLLTIGILFILIGIIFAPQIREIPAAVISTIGSFSIWEASAEWIEIFPALRKKERVLKRMADADIVTSGSDIK